MKFYWKTDIILATKQNWIQEVNIILHFQNHLIYRYDSLTSFSYLLIQHFFVSVLKFTQPYTVFHIGQVKHSRIPPKTLWQTKFIQNQNKFVKFNFSLSRSAIISIYGRRYSPPTIAQFDFFEVFNANHIATRNPSSNSKVSLYFHYLPVLK